MRNMGLTPREQKVLRGIERRRNQYIDLLGLAVAIALGLGVAIGLGVIFKYIFG